MSGRRRAVGHSDDSNQICRSSAIGASVTTGQVGLRSYGSVALLDYVFLVDNVAAPAL